MKIKIALTLAISLFSTISFGETASPGGDRFKVTTCHGPFGSDALQKMDDDSESGTEYLFGLSDRFLIIGGLKGAITSVQNVENGGKLTKAQGLAGRYELIFMLLESGMPPLTRELNIVESATGAECTLVPVSSSP